MRHKKMDILWQGNYLKWISLQDLQCSNTFIQNREVFFFSASKEDSVAFRIHITESQSSIS